MFNSTSMQSIKHYTTVANKTVMFATVYIMNAYQKYPDMYNFMLRKADNDLPMFLTCLFYWILFALLVRSLVRACMDPFSLKLHTKISELENKLSEEEDLYSELVNENHELSEKLKEAEKALADVNAQYLSCRQAAQRFLDATSGVSKPS